VAKHIIDLLKPRLAAFIERFKDVVKAEPSVREHTRAMNLSFAATLRIPTCSLSSEGIGWQPWLGFSSFRVPPTGMRDLPTPNRRTGTRTARQDARNARRWQLEVFCPCLRLWVMRKWAHMNDEVSTNLECAVDDPNKSKKTRWFLLGFVCGAAFVGLLLLLACYLFMHVNLLWWDRG
jgi:hypothetical protein